MHLRQVGAALAVLALAACATPGPPPPAAPPTRAPAQAPVTPQPPAPPDHPIVIPLAQLRGWADEDHAAAFSALRDTCQVARTEPLSIVCRKAKAAGALGAAEAKAWLEANFLAESVVGEGVLTAYFAPVYPARTKPDAEFSAPVRPRPADLRVSGGEVSQILSDGRAVPYPDRAAIEAARPDRALAWMRPEDLFFLQVQGSGVLTFEDDRRMKALYAAHNGRPFMAIANPMRDRGLLPRDQTSGDAIRSWLAANRGPDADAIMRLNPRYAFFSLAPDDGAPPRGAANIPLPGGRAVAIDPAHHRYGQPMWIDGEAPLLAGAFPAYRRMVMALDTGGAIRGEVRADLYLGQGDAAGLEAGRVRHTLRLWRLVPR